jgi:hypothetical protein
MRSTSSYGLFGGRSYDDDDSFASPKVESASRKVESSSQSKKKRRPTEQRFNKHDEYHTVLLLTL